MTQNAALALLPAGLHDLLPPDAEREAALVERAMAVFRAHGYERVKPPLVEFEESLLSGVGRSRARQTFRLLDPESQRMMGVRADMTLQVARIAASRLANAPRPLRLCYAGEVLRVGGEQLRPERQVRQIGCELIGSLEPAAVAETVLLASSALARVGISGLSIDLNLPTMVPTLFAAYGVTGEAEQTLAAALAHRDAAAAAANPEIGTLLVDLLEAAGPAAPAVARLNRLDLPDAARLQIASLAATIELIRSADPALTLTVDPLERQGFEYQTGVGFTIFARGALRELGRGGRYRIGLAGDEAGEPAVGFSLFSDAVLGSAPADAPPRRVYIAPGTRFADAEMLRADGWVTVAGLGIAEKPADDARRLGCGYILTPDSAEPRRLD
jgi:ATP phosphoribosyltransferase regulatory subunit